MNKLKNLKKIIFFGLGLLILTPFNLSLAQGKSITNQMVDSLKDSSLATTPTAGAESVVGGIIQVFLSLFGIVFLGLMVYGGYIWLKAQGREEEVKRAKDTIRSAIIGIIIVLAAYTISYYVVNALVSVAPVK